MFNLAAVKLDFAYAGNTLRHISEELYRSTIYTCPFCNESLTYRKGDEREHHFSHKPNSICTASYETVLHFNAKYYLESECAGPSGYSIFFDFHLKNHIEAVNTLSNILNINDTYTTSLHDILLFYGALKGAQVEHKVGPYIADVFCETKNENGFVFEVFVTHEMDLVKRNYLENNNIPYLELVPSQNEKSRISFQLESYYLPNFFYKKSEEIESKLSDMYYNNYQEELIERAKEPLNEKNILNFKSQAVKALILEVEKASFQKSIGDKLLNETHLITAQAFNSRISRKETLVNIQYVSNRDRTKKYLMVNDKNHFLSSEQNLLFEIINKFADIYHIEALVGGWNDKKNESVIGFEFNIPNSNGIEKYIKSILSDILNSFDDRFQKKISSLQEDYQEK